MRIPFVDLQAQYRSIQREIDDAMAAVIRDAAFIGTRENKYVRRFEEQFAGFLGAAHCIACANGTDAIELMLESIGVREGDEVIVPAHSWISTSEAVTAVRATPVFVDTLPGVFTIDPERIAERVTARTRAIIPVHLYGLPAEMDEILLVARRFGLRVLEDCAQAHGGTYRGRAVGTMGDAASFSFFPGKNLGAYGDAGAVVTGDAEIAERIRLVSNHGQVRKNVHACEGRNSRMDGLQAAVLLAKLPHLSQWTEQRIEHAQYYSSALADLPLQLPVVPQHSRHVFHIYSVLHDARERIGAELQQQDIATAVHYPNALPFLPPYAAGGQRGDYPFASATCRRQLSLPLYPEMTQEIQDTVIGALRRSLGATVKARA